MDGNENKHHSSSWAHRLFATLCPHRLAVPANVSKVKHLSLNPRMMSLHLMLRTPLIIFQVFTQQVSTRFLDLDLGSLPKHPNPRNPKISFLQAAMTSVLCLASSSFVNVSFF